MEKKMTVPRSAVARIAPPSQPGTSTQTTVTSAGPPAAGRRRRAARSGRGRRRPRPRRRGRRRAAARPRPRAGTTPMVRCAPASRAAARLSEPDLPAAADHGDHRAVRRTRSTTRRGQRRGAADVHHRQAELGRAGRRAAPRRSSGRRGRRTRRTGTCSLRPSQRGQAVLDDERGEGQRDQGGDPVADGEAERRLRADLLDGADEHAAGAGLGVLHLAAGGDDRRGPRRAPRRRRPACLPLELAERGGVEVEPLDADPDLVGPQLAAGVEPLGGLRQHRRARPGPVQTGGIAGQADMTADPPSRPMTRKSAAWHWTAG